MLAGALVAFVSWGYMKSKKDNDSAPKEWPVLASYAACALARHSSKLAFAEHKRATTTPGVIVILF